MSGGHRPRGSAVAVLHLDDVRKTYHAGSFTQSALDGVTITFRDNEFVAILGPSGSGKTTLLNIVGGLDHADSGDLAIDGISTQQFRDRDWDAYRNNRIGFVFQSYNLIPHQSVLANVELALTLSGVGPAERARRAKEALEQVGLGEHIHKLPNQLSGGQMQRVAIARALVNDPEIVLADEPTGALDSTTGTQVMNLLQTIAQDRLVVMVTHNPDLASQYATRTVSLKDGKVVGDTAPYVPGEDVREAKPARRTSMSFFTAIALSFTNLMTKKGRTLMTSFAGSIGIVGIACILALANGVNNYINSVEQDTLSLYPLTIQTQGIDLSSMLTPGNSGSGTDSSDSSATSAPGDAHEVPQLARMFSHIGTNDLTSLKSFLDSPSSGMQPYVNSIEYDYDITPQIFASDTSKGVRQVNPNTVFSALGSGSGMGRGISSMTSSLAMGMTANAFSPLPADTELLAGQYDVVAGHWPTSYNQAMLVLTSTGGVSDYTLYTMGLRDPAQLTTMVKQLASGKPISVPTDNHQQFSYQQLMGVGFSVVPATAFYEYDPTYHIWTDRSTDQTWMKNAVEHGEPLSIVGIAKPDPTATATMLSPGLYYSASLVTHLMDEAAASPIIKQQLAEPDVNVFSGDTFASEAKSLQNFDFSSLLNVNPDAMSSLLDLDPSQFSIDTNSLNLSSLAKNAQGLSLPPPDLSAMLGSLNLNVSPQAVTNLVTQTLGDYLNDEYGSILDGLAPPASPSAPPTSAPTTSAAPSPSATPTSAPTASPTSAPPATQEPTSAAPTSSAPTQEPSVDPTSAAPTTDAPQPPDETSAPPVTTFGAAAPTSAPAPAGTNTPLTPAAAATPMTLAIAAAAAAEPTATADPSEPSPSEPASSAPASSAPASSAPASSAPASSAAPSFTLPTSLPTSWPTNLPTSLPTALPTALPNLPTIPGVDAVVASFTQWFNQPSVQATFMNRLTQALDLTSVEKQIATAMTGYLQQTMQTQLSSMMNALQTQLSVAMQSTMSQMKAQLSSAMKLDPSKLSQLISFKMDPSQLTTLLMSMMNNQTNSLDSNLQLLGYANPATPSSIDIYPKDFAAKQQVINILDAYNARMTATDQSSKVITYTDIVGTLMSSVTDIVNKISAVLVAFVSISLVVSSIMIGVITYISVLERRKEIGILRALGASKRNIGNVFNAETLIVGFVAGVMGVLITVALCLIANPIINHLYNIKDIARLPLVAAVALIAISMLLTFVAGLIPSSAASRRDPVEALRSE